MPACAEGITSVADDRRPRGPAQDAPGGVSTPGGWSGAETSAPAPLPDSAARAFAVDPANNVVLEASAGTGKTSVLVERYLNLLKASVDPANILAMTFTRKAATEMRERIVQALREEAGRGEGDGARWRALRDRLADVEITTIDAFCLSLLREFPLEAGLDPGFSIVDDTEVPRLVEEALGRTLEACSATAITDPDMALLVGHLGPSRLRVGLGHLLARRLVAPGALDRYLSGAPTGVAGDAACRRVAERLREAMEALPGGLGQFLDDGPVGHPRFQLLVRALRRVDRLPEADPAVIRSTLEQVADYFLTRSGRPRLRLTSYTRRDCVSEAAWRRHTRAMAGVAPRIAGALGSFVADLNVVLAGAARRVLSVALREYRDTLSRYAVLDFPEALDRALGLLRQMDEFAQSRYRLESRYHHVLVDEFQDTSRAQWDLVSLLVRSWGEGFGLVHEAPVPPSIFLVADRKQSIYRFRDAEVDVLSEAAGHVDALRSGGTARRWISHSFRALPALLAFVNDLFSDIQQPEDRDDAFRYGEHDLFPLDSSTLDDSGALGLVVGDGLEANAEAVADEIVQLLSTGRVRDRRTGELRRVGPGDVGILFRSRDTHREFQAALEARRIPVYVYKGLGFFDAEEVKDLCALLAYLADPESDLRAAALLRSRFVRLSDEGIRRLAPGLAGVLIGEDPSAPIGVLDDEDARVMRRLRASIGTWLSRVDRTLPADLLDQIVKETAYAYELRAGGTPQARENVKKLSGLVRRLQNRGFATISRIAEHLDRLSGGDEANAVVDAVDAVSLMTVHAAKGLEFPVVFVVDLSRGVSGGTPPIRVIAGSTRRAPTVSIAGLGVSANPEERAREREETKRLLYVAATRARDRLYLSATVTNGKLRPARGSLAEVLPAGFGQVIETAAVGTGSTATWHSRRARGHGLRVCRAQPRRMALSFARTPEGGSDRPEDDFDTIDVHTWRTREFEEASPASGRSPIDRPRADRISRVWLGRLFAAEIDENADASSIRRRLVRLVRPDEVAEVAEVDAVLDRVAAAYRELCRDTDLLSVLRSGDCLHDVAFSVRVSSPEPAGDAGIHRGVIRCLVRRPIGGICVAEFVPGPSTPADRVRLELCRTAAVSLYPGQPVSSRLYALERDDGDEGD